MNKTGITVLLIALGAFLGYYGNVLANKKNNELLVKLLKDQLLCVDNQLDNPGQGESGRSDLYEKKKYLETQLAYYSKKYGIYA